METGVLAFILRAVHLFATLAWIGGMITNFFIYVPAIRKVLDPAGAGKLMFVVMNRFKIMVYISIGLLLLTGMISSYIHFTSTETIAVTGSWNTLLVIKLSLFALMSILAVYAFEFLAPRVSATAVKGPSPELQRLQKTQMIMALLGFIMGIAIVILSAAL